MALTLPAFAKINLDLRVLGTRADGNHDLKTIFQTLSLHDTITFEPRRGPFEIVCDDPAVPVDRRNLVWKAAALLWSVARPRRRGAPRDVRITLRKRIPAASGLGGGSADAAMALLGLARVWKLSLDLTSLSRLGAELGADVPFFLVGGTALGLGRGDDIYPLADLPKSWVVLVRPAFGVSTADAYQWFDREPRGGQRPALRRPPPAGWPAWAADLRNDLEPAVVRHHPAIGRIRQALVDAGAAAAAMSGSGSAVFGLFERADAARRTAADLARPGWLVVAASTLSRSGYNRRLSPALAGRPGSRIR
ncbi:MAG: 4-(cytidine 5'-diphospho)-2-C-methyl-D-erythritol kinase [Acidobacteriota bacterium]